MNYTARNSHLFHNYLLHLDPFQYEDEIPLRKASASIGAYLVWLEAPEAAAA